MVRPIIRELRHDDGSAAVDVFFDAVMNGTAGHYTLAQRRAWAGPGPDAAGWRDRLAGVEGFAAEIGGRLIGFMTLDRNGHIDLAFVLADCAGQGTGHQLYQHIEALAQQRGIPTLTTEASEAARLFFTRHGWLIEAQQQVVKRGVTLTNYRMFKPLG